jgi:hypothetical protein
VVVVASIVVVVRATDVGGVVDETVGGVVEEGVVGFVVEPNVVGVVGPVGFVVAVVAGTVVALDRVEASLSGAVAVSAAVTPGAACAGARVGSPATAGAGVAGVVNNSVEPIELVAIEVDGFETRISESGASKASADGIVLVRAGLRSLLVFTFGWQMTRFTTMVRRLVFDPTALRTKTVPFFPATDFAPSFLAGMRQELFRLAARALRSKLVTEKIVRVRTAVATEIAARVVRRIREVGDVKKFVMMGLSTHHRTLFIP